VFISHKLDEVMEISDRISVMRQGQYMGTVNVEETSPLDLTKRMIGREVFLNIDKSYGKAGKTILEVKDVWVSSNKETSKIRGMSLHVKEGEIVGIAGIDGNGQSELIEAITGIRKVEKGSVILNGKDITNFSPKKVRDAGLAHIPEDRNKRGLNRSMSIVDNLVAVRLDEEPFSKNMLICVCGSLIGEGSVLPFTMLCLYCGLIALICSMSRLRTAATCCRCTSLLTIIVSVLVGSVVTIGHMLCSQ
jgi:simple sugar transport system ATP-binding protein